MIAKIATGEIEDITSEDDKNTAAGRMGGKARVAARQPGNGGVEKKVAKSLWKPTSP